MATLRDLKGRIGSVSSSEKITGAMKMISSAKMSKATREIKRLLPYRQQLESIIGNLLSADVEFSSPLTEERAVKHLTILVWGSDDGLCGAYNVNIFKQLLEHINSLREHYGRDVEIELIAIGQKMYRAASKLAGDGIAVSPAPEGVDSKSDADAVKRFTTEIECRFTSGATDKVDIVYMHFISAGRQRLAAEQLLPVQPNTQGPTPSAQTPGMYILEPDAQSIFSTALPLMLLSTMQEVFCENRASEQAARVMAMQAANDNATKLLEQLRLEYNKLRQQSITAELLDILGGQVR
ncbi:MAG: ATP synthase F1 subunit gamma [Bacteroides sp.]|nr:ATP synthase F1 subunit gamma [Bacteroides sp.]MCM1378798.1 ATP synthase F1 subunit gamma [Bacteroides sp.]MCM1445415.1 ATP synthase F1 subunit gamma [Prevotella sp.]